VIYQGSQWESIGRWADARGMDTKTARRSVTTGGVVMGKLLHDDPHSGRRIVEAAGVPVLVVPIRGQQWLYLRADAPGKVENAT